MQMNISALVLVTGLLAIFISANPISTQYDLRKKKKGKAENIEEKRDQHEVLKGLTNKSGNALQVYKKNNVI